MSASEIIEQIKALPPEEKAQILDFVRKMEQTEKSIRYASPEQVEAIGEKVLQRYEGVFRRLAR